MISLRNQDARDEGYLEQGLIDATDATIQQDHKLSYSRHSRNKFIGFFILFNALVYLSFRRSAISSYTDEIEKHSKNEFTVAEHDTMLQNIEYWCLDGSDYNCPKCEDPTQPSPRSESQYWDDTFARNLELSRTHKNDPLGVDVIFMGGANIEARLGTYKGSKGNDIEFAHALSESKLAFDHYFKNENGGVYRGLALGIAGDTSPNLLWRIKQGEFGDLQPKVWWISIGINDLLNTHCNGVVTAVGIFRIVEELTDRNDGSLVVINSILPVATHSDLSLAGKDIDNKYWTSIEEVNEILQKFAQRQGSNVKFFDSNQVLTEHKGGDLYMKKEMFMDKVHLSGEGQRAMAEAQAHMLDLILPNV